MTPMEQHPTQKHPRQLDPETIRRVMSDLREPLTALYTLIYLLKRRIQQDQVSETHHCLNDLTALKEDAQVMEARMQDLEKMADRLEPSRKIDQNGWPSRPAGKGILGPDNEPLL
jgi:hypothetical protein